MIVYELNEVPKKLFEFYAAAFPNSAFSKLLKEARCFETETADVGSLSPWVTWPTMHRGVPNTDHEISDLGQDLSPVNKEFPEVYELLASQGVKVGVFGPLHSYPLPNDLANYAYYVPDTFAAGSECFPNTLSAFQRFNLSMVKASGRNVSMGIAVKDCVSFLKTAYAMGLTLDTTGKLGLQLLQERFNSDRVVRRRTSQVEIAFDLFYHQQLTTHPDISFFFTNHVASSMHRYWPTVFPNDYAEGKFDKQWLSKWASEIPHAVKVANYQLGKLIQYCEEHQKDLVVCSSMGQGAVKDVKRVKSQVLITNINKLLEYIGCDRSEWEPRLSMAPQVVIKPLSLSFNDKLTRLNKVLINGEKIQHFITSTGDVRFEIKLYDVDHLSIIDNGTQISNEALGVSSVNLQDGANAYAYHIPEGILLYLKGSKTKRKTNRGFEKVSVLDFTPSLLQYFDQPIPFYMQGQNSLFV